MNEFLYWYVIALGGIVVVSLATLVYTHFQGQRTGERLHESVVAFGVNTQTIVRESRASTEAMHRETMQFIRAMQQDTTQFLKDIDTRTASIHEQLAEDGDAPSA